jgi:nicotinamide riboside transporter PnuC
MTEPTSHAAHTPSGHIDEPESETQEPESRTVASPTTGSRLCLLVAALTLLLAVYWLVAPITIHTTTGRLFDCGNAITGPKSDFARGLCGQAPRGERAKAIAAAVVALGIAVGGLAMFGFTRRQQPRVSHDESAADAA